MLVIFDCDGVLINSEEIAIAADLVFLAKHGLAYTSHEFSSLYSGIIYEEMIMDIGKRYNALHGVALPDGFMASMQQHHLDIVYPQIREVKGIREVLAFLKENGIPFCVASNSGTKDLVNKLKMVGLYDLFAPHIFSKDMVTNPKPAPDLFLHAAAEMGGFAAKDCIVVEDSAPGATAGVRAGMYVLGYSAGSHRPAGYPDILKKIGVADTAATMAEMLGLLRQRLAPRPKPDGARPAPFLAFQ